MLEGIKYAAELLDNNLPLDLRCDFLLGLNLFLGATERALDGTVDPLKRGEGNIGFEIV